MYTSPVLNRVFPLSRNGLTALLPRMKVYTRVYTSRPFRRNDEKIKTDVLVSIRVYTRIQSVRAHPRQPSSQAGMNHDPERPSRIGRKLASQRHTAALGALDVKSYGGARTCLYGLANIIYRRPPFRTHFSPPIRIACFQAVPYQGEPRSILPTVQGQQGRLSRPRTAASGILGVNHRSRASTRLDGRPIHKPSLAASGWSTIASVSIGI